MFKSKLNISLKKLLKYCENEKYIGWDPYDGLNSNFFNLFFFKKIDFVRFFWIQFFKISPINFRKILCVPKEYNSKGIALMLSGYCNMAENMKKKNKSFGEINIIINKIKLLSETLISLRINGYSGACWGYNFNWQARRLFFFPKNTPNVVVTTFCVEALLKAYEIIKNERLKTIAISSAKFILNDLNRTNYKNGFLFSYSPLKGNDTVFNASALGAKCLALCYRYTKNKELLKISRIAIETVCDAQNEDGSWIYGLNPVQKWIDSFHTGYNLEAIYTYQKISKDNSFNKSIDNGFKFYINNFFTSDGMPKYYHNKVYPIDIHCPAQLFVTLDKLNRFSEYKKLALKVLNWTIDNMQSKSGYFYFQKRKLFTNRISYMRWSNAFMFNSLTHYLIHDKY